MIAAMGENRVIGLNNRLPWILPADTEHFRKVTAGKPFIMGRNSYLSEDALLSESYSVILSHHRDLVMLPGCRIAENIEEAFHLLKEEPEIITRGFVYTREADMLMEATHKVINETIWNSEEDLLQEDLQQALKALFYNVTKRRPMIFVILSRA